MSETDNRSDSVPQRLESWREIASYLGREVRTCQRWEKLEGLPVHRQRHIKLPSVYAFVTELDEWRRSREISGADTQENCM